VYEFTLASAGRPTVSSHFITKRAAQLSQWPSVWPARPSSVLCICVRDQILKKLVKTIL